MARTKKPSIRKRVFSALKELGRTISRHANLYEVRDDFNKLPEKHKNRLTGGVKLYKEPVIQFTTPSGNPASDTNFINSKVDAEVNSDGFITAVFPAARAGASFQDKRSKGEFQAVIIPTTPNGSYLV